VAGLVRIAAVGIGGVEEVDAFVRAACSTPIARASSRAASVDSRMQPMPTSDAGSRKLFRLQV
jgi:hypothetical protein